MSVSSQTMGLIIGGLMPAVLFTMSNLGSKASIQAGISMGPYLTLVGTGVLLTGIVAFFIWPDRVVSLHSGGIALGFGLAWGIGVGCIAIALANYNAAIGQLAPLFNVNTLFTTLIALWIFAEWKQVHVPQLLLGTVLIVIGATLVARS